MVYDPLVNSIDDISYFALTDGIGICIDTSHYGITEKALNEVASRGLTAHDRCKRGILGVTEFDLRPQPKLTDLPGILGESLMYAHVSDFKDTWIPGTSFFSEGLVPGEGEYGDEIAHFIKAIAEKDIAINVEIKDHDLTKLHETKRGIRKVMQTLANTA